MKRRCSIHQPHFMPYLGVLEKIQRADCFVFLDTVQFEKNEWQNRNRIRTRDGGVRWITVPVNYRYPQEIREVSIATGLPWKRKILGSLEQHYRKSRFFADYMGDVQKLLSGDYESLASLSCATTKWLMHTFGISTETIRSSELLVENTDPTGRLIDICKAVGAEVYLSGALGRDYLDPKRFETAGIELEFQDYKHPVYPQLAEGQPFQSHLSALDAVLTCGGGPEGRQQLGFEIS